MSEWFEWREAPPGDFAVIGDPIEHSLSPLMHQAAYQAVSFPYSYRAIRIPVGEELEALTHLSRIGYRGVNVTAPLKEAVLPWLSSVEPFAKRARAVNTIDFEDQRGTNTDGPGFVQALSELGVDAGANVMVCGVGGSGRAVALALSDAGYSLTLYNRTASRAFGLAAEIGGVEVRDVPDPAGMDAIVNATSVSLTGDSLPIDWSRAEGKALAFDLIYADAPTPFLQDGARVGLRTIDGRALLAAQGELSFAWWFGRKPPPGVMLNAIS